MVSRVLSAARGQLTVEQTDTAVSLTWRDELPLPLLTNGEKKKRTLAGLGEVELKAEWKDGLLIVEQKLDGGVRVRREFVHGPDSPRLIVVTTVSGAGPGDITFHYVYDAARPDPGPGPGPLLQ